MADVFLNSNETEEYFRKAEKKYPKGTVIDVLLLDKPDDTHIIYAVEKGCEAHKKKKKKNKAKKKAKKMKKVDKKINEIIEVINSVSKAAKKIKI